MTIFDPNRELLHIFSDATSCEGDITTQQALRRKDFHPATNYNLFQDLIGPEQGD
jgi:hypothetical protein